MAIKTGIILIFFFFLLPGPCSDSSSKLAIAVLFKSVQVVYEWDLEERLGTVEEHCLAVLASLP